jgi:hypothetical protein
LLSFVIKHAFHFPVIFTSDVGTNANLIFQFGKIKVVMETWLIIIQCRDLFLSLIFSDTDL